jgi:hypothetical protein
MMSTRDEALRLAAQFHHRALWYREWAKLAGSAFDRSGRLRIAEYFDARVATLSAALEPARGDQPAEAAGFAESRSG